MEPIAKFLRKVDRQQRTRLQKVLRSIETNKLTGLDIKPLSGQRGWWRCRVGRFRIVFVKTNSGANIVFRLDWRGNAYKKK